MFLDDTVVEYPNDVTIELAEFANVFISSGEVDGTSGPTSLEPGSYEISSGTMIEWQAGTTAPHASSITPITGQDWARPLGDKNIAGGHPLYFSVAIVLANMFGLMGLPHVVVRFYTNPTGREARRTNLIVLALIAPYYAMIPLFGAASRVLSPGLLGTATTDSATVSVGERLIEGLGGELITAVVSAGAAAAFLSTSSEQT